MLFSCVRLVDDQIGILRGQAAVEEAETSAHLAELIHVEAGNGVEEFKRLNHGASGESDVWLLHENRWQTITHGSRTQRRKGRRSRRTNENIGSRPSCAAGRFVQRSVTDAYQCENHRHFYCNREDAQNGTNRSMCEVGQDEFIEQDHILSRIDLLR